MINYIHKIINCLIASIKKIKDFILFFIYQIFHINFQVCQQKEKYIYYQIIE